MVLAAGLLPYAATTGAKWGLRAYDNHAPRAWLANQTGFRARANAAQLNSFEAFPFFAAAVLVTQQAHLAQERIDTLAVAFVALRVVYLGCYLADLPTLRSTVWTAGIACVVAIFLTTGGLP